MTTPTTPEAGAEMQMSDDLIKQLRAQAEQIASEGHAGWGNLNTEAAALIEQQAARIALLSAIKPAVPQGWKLVPIEPTVTMISEGSCAQSLPGPRYISESAARSCWSNMLAAAPAAPTAQPATLQAISDKAHSGNTTSQPAPQPAVDADSELKRIGAQMANTMFNLAQRPGSVLDAELCAKFDAMRRQWDAAVSTRAAASAQATGQAVAEIVRQELNCIDGTTQTLVAAFVLDAGKQLPHGAQLFSASAAPSTAPVIDKSMVKRLAVQFGLIPEAERSAWQPIETAPMTGRTLLLGYLNAAGKWRTVRGQWMSEAYIAEQWEEPDGVEPGWFETSVEAEDPPNCWRIEPTHWMPLPKEPK